MVYYHQQLIENDALSAEEKTRYDAFRGQLSGVAETIMDWQQSKALPILSAPHDAEEAKRIAALGSQIRQRSKGLVVLGTGGSSLGGKTLCELGDADYPVHFIENLDPYSMEQFLAREALDEMHLLIVSKSGGTMETLSQAMVMIGAMSSVRKGTTLADCAHAITMPGERGLRSLAAHYEIPILDHDPLIGGRFSVLSNVGLLPAATAGVDIEKLLDGAASVLDTLTSPETCAPLIGAAWQVALMPMRPTSVLMPYCDRLSLLGDWFRQLWAESLGKDGLGSTPADALGAVDQHSQLQLYLDGPKDKVFTLVTLPHAGLGPKIPMPPVAEFNYLGGKTIGDAMAALQHGTIETLRRHHLPLRLLELERLDEQTLGALLMHYIIETMASAQLMGVDAFDQPAVEESKQLAREALSQ